MKRYDQDMDQLEVNDLKIIIMKQEEQLVNLEHKLYELAVKLEGLRSDIKDKQLTIFKLQQNVEKNKCLKQSEMAALKKEHTEKLDEAKKAYIESIRIKLVKDPNIVNVHFLQTSPTTLKNHEAPTQQNRQNQEYYQQKMRAIRLTIIKMIKILQQNLEMDSQKADAFLLIANQLCKHFA